MHAFIWGLKCLLGMLRCMLERVKVLKVRTLRGRGIRKWEGGRGMISVLKNTTAVVESLSTTSTRCSVTEITSLLQDSTNRMGNLHQIILQEYGLEVLHLLRDWERLWLRASDYKNHRIFTLRCMHKDLIPVNIKLKSTLKTERAKNIVRKAEENLLQARVKAINSILYNISYQTELCRSQLVSILSAQRLRECQGFI